MFEDVAAAHSLKFEKVLLALSLLSVVVFLVVWVASPLTTMTPTPARLVIGIINVAFHVAALFARRWKRFPVSKAAAFCMLFNLASFSILRPAEAWQGQESLYSIFLEGISHVYSNIPPDALEPLQMQLRQWPPDDIEETRAVFEQYSSLALAEWRERTAWRVVGHFQAYAARITIYTFITWYSVAFLMLFRHAVPASALALIIHFAVGAARGNHEIRVVLLSIDAPLMLMPTVAACIGKFISERFQRKAFALMEERRLQAVQEKVLRFKAEFEQDRLKLPNIPKGKDVSGNSEVSAWSLSFSAHSIAPPSVHSAPPCSQYADVGCLAKPGQCLHPDALVWPLGSSAPKKVLEVEAGQSVLCYDNVSGSVSYAEVTGCQQLGGDVPWVSVTLIDGTSMTLTADHPVQPLSSRSDGHYSPLTHNLGAIVKAVDLKPGKDSLAVLRLLPTAVQKVEDAACVASATGTGRVALSVQQPLRHSIFVAESGSRPELQTRVAVSSANLQTQDVCGLLVRRTFLHHGPTPQILRRCKSAPPGGCLDSMRRLHRKDHSIDSETRLPVSTRSQQMVADGDCDDAHLASAPGFESTGSSTHALGTCSVCVFQNGYHHALRGSPCTKGVSCSFCSGLSQL